MKAMSVKISKGTEEVWGRVRMQKGHMKPQRKRTGGGCPTQRYYVGTVRTLGQQNYPHK